jgi:hypothetical protein
VNDPPSVLGKHAMEGVLSPILCPDIATWLGQLDLDFIRSQMQIDFAQYSGLLLWNRFFELSDLANVSADQLLSDRGMNFGIATHLIMYTKEDFSPFATKRV